MARSFQDSLDYDAENVLLNSNEFGQTVVHTSPQVAPEEIPALVDEDALEANMPPVTDEAGTRVKQRAVIEVLASVNVVEEQADGRYGSTFLIDGHVWLAKRILSKDSATQSVEIHRTDQKATKRVRA